MEMLRQSRKFATTQAQRHAPCRRISAALKLNSTSSLTHRWNASELADVQAGAKQWSQVLKEKTFRYRRLESISSCLKTGQAIILWPKKTRTCSRRETKRYHSGVHHTGYISPSSHPVRKVTVHRPGHPDHAIPAPAIRRIYEKG